MQATTDPARMIRLQSRCVGKAIGRSETPTTTTICTYTLDGDDAGMARWAEDDGGNVTVYAFDYPGWPPGQTETLPGTTLSHRSRPSGRTVSLVESTGQARNVELQSPHTPLHTPLTTPMAVAVPITASTDYWGPIRAGGSPWDAS